MSGSPDHPGGEGVGPERREGVGPATRACDPGARGVPEDRSEGPFDVVVVGGGVIGASIAWRAASRGQRLVVVDPAPGGGASWAAAGMLAPVTEVHHGEETLLSLNLESARRWPAFARELEEAAGTEVGYRPCGTLLVAVDDGDRSLLEELFDFQRGLGLEVEWLTGRSARDLERNLAPGIRAAMRAINDHQVDNRLLVRALLTAARRCGCTLDASRAASIELAGNRLEGVRLEDGRLLGSRSVVIAAGAWSGQIMGIPETALPPVRPVKGQIMRLTSPPGPPLLERSVRGLVNAVPVYLVPRADGTVVIGGTVEEKGFDTSVTALGVYEILRDAHRVVPGVSELRFDEAIARLRPGSPDNSPIVGDLGSWGLPELVVATGHYRNGVLLAPVTADAVCAMLAGETAPSEMKAFSPDRFQARS